MPLRDITRSSLDVLTRYYRAPVVLPGPVPPSRGEAPAPQDPSYAVVDEFIRMVPFVAADIEGRPIAGQFQVSAHGSLREPPFSARAGGQPWIPGATTAFGQALDAVGTRFKKISVTVRSDELMVTDENQDMLRVQVGLAQISIVRSLSEALLNSLPANDDQAELAGLPFYLAANSPQDVLFDARRGIIGGLSEIEARCASSDADYGGRPDAFVLSSRSRWRLLKELEDKGVMPEFRWSRLFDRLLLHFHGVPVLTGRVQEPSTPVPPTTQAWAVKLWGPSGICIYHIGGESRFFGVRVESSTTMVTVDGTGEASNATKAVEVFGVYAASVPESNSIARLRGIPALDPFA